MPDSLSNSTALVTGATAGIGRATALKLAGLGAEVIVHGRDAERGKAVVAEIESAGGKARLLTADLRHREETRRLAAESGAVDVLVNNAGIYRMGPTAETDDESFDEHIETNLHAPFLLVQALVPGMVERGSGSVVNVSTFGASVAGMGGGIYGASKAALELFTKVWADEFAAGGVRVNAVAAGPVRTPGTEAFGPMAEALGQAFAQERVAEAEEIAEAIAFLAGPAASYVNGDVLQIHGGIKAVRPPAM